MALIRSVRDTESVNEDLKASIERCLHSFINNKDTAELNFMSSFTAPERSYVHYLAKSLKLMSKSRGKGMNRAVTVYKCERSSIIHRDATFHLTTLSHKVITTLMTQAPLTSKEKLDITPHSERDRTSAPDNIQREPNRCVNRLVTGVPIVPTIRRPPADQAQSTNAHRHQLPIHALRESIIQTINDNPVVVISGETGSGKTTQVPQYIMEYHERVGRACRIICSQPRRIAAVAMGERVAFERNCKVGTEVGYQIRHESVTNSRTILTYITNGILLRTLMCGDSSLATVTHLIMDEIHVRDRVADFILVAVREALAKYRSLRLVLISASVDTASFSKYFNNCPVITVPGRLYEVKEYFLEDILKLTDYKTKEMEKYRNESKKRSQQDQEAKEWMIQAKENKSGLSPTANSQGKSKSQEKGVDFYLENATRLGCQESLKQIVHLIKNNEASVDHQHPSTRVTPLIAACIHGHIEIVEQLLNLGASLHLAINRNQTAIEFAREFGHQNIVDILTLYSFVYFAKGSNDSHKPSAIPDDKYVLLESYKYCFKETIVNPDLILAIVNKIQTSNQMGAVLIFLPGYEEIVMMLEKLSKREPKPNECLLKLVALHSKMDTCDQKIVFQPAPMGMRKIILSTNIAESCITLQDVVFVVDTGLVRECCQSLRVRTVRCSQWCVRQRRARAGRLQPGGHCYHLFSAADYHAMPAYPTPQILRTPLQNLCLQTKLLAQGNIADFIAKTLDPPSFTVVRTAVQLLKTIDALDPCEEVTLLGQHLIDLPLAPHLGKALIYAVLLKCLDPVLTIVAMLSYDDPFLTPDQPSQRREAQVMRRKMADRSQSDHCLLLQVFMKWLAARNQGHGRLYCQKNYLCEARLEMVHSHRAQLLTQLRSSGFVRAKDMGSDVRDLNQNSEKLSVVKAALTGGLYPNLVRVDRELNSLRTHDLAKVTLHPSSVLRGSNGLQKNVASTLATDWIVYDEVISAGNTSQVRVCSLVTDVTVAIFAGPSRYSTEQFIDPDAADRGSDSEEEEVLDKRTATFKVDEWAVFRVQPHIARLIIMLRNKWHAVLAKRLRTPYKPPLPNDEAVIEALVAVLCSEEEEVGLQQPTGIGAKPLLINNQENDFSPLIGRRSNNDISKQLSSALDISGNRHPNHRRTYDMNDNASNSTVGTSSSNSCSLSPSLSQGSSSQLEQATAGNRAFFIIRYGNTRSFERACSTNVWHFQSNTEMRLKNAYREGKTVILIISLQGSSHFQGYARLKSDHCEWNDVIFDQSAHSMSPSMGGAVPLPIEWLKIGNIQANSLRHFCGNDFNRLLTYRDGHEIDSNMGEALCLLWEAQVPHNPPLGHHVFHQTPGNGHGRPIRAPPQQQYYGNNSYGPPHGGPNGSHNMRQNM